MHLQVPSWSELVKNFKNIQETVGSHCYLHIPPSFIPHIEMFQFTNFGGPEDGVCIGDVSPLLPTDYIQLQQGRLCINPGSIVIGYILGFTETHVVLKIRSLDHLVPLRDSLLLQERHYALSRSLFESGIVSDNLAASNISLLKEYTRHCRGYEAASTRASEEHCTVLPMFISKMDDPRWDVYTADDAMIMALSSKHLQSLMFNHATMQQRWCGR